MRQVQDAACRGASALSGSAAATSNVPFMAIAAGRNPLKIAEIGAWKILLRLAAYAALLVLHHRLFGVHALM